MGFFSRFFSRKETPEAEPVQPATTPEPVQPDADADQKTVTYKVAGVSHYRENILSLGFENEDYSLSKKALIKNDLVETRIWKYDFYPSRAELVPEPDNPKDPNAIKVVVDGLHVGYIKAGSCSHLLRVMQEGKIKKIDVKVGGGPYKYLECVDYTESGDEVYEQSSETVPLYVHLSITEL